MFGLKRHFHRLKNRDVPEEALLRQRRRLEIHMAAYPLRHVRNRRPSFGLAYRPLMAVFVIMAVLGSTGGVVFAAQESLPGETLYPVKIASEEVRVRLALSQDAQFRYRSRLAERRLTEAEELFTANQESPEERDRRVAIAMERYEHHVVRLNGIVERFEDRERPKDPSRAIEAVERVLGTHARLLDSATATDDGSDMSMAAYAKDTIDLEEKLIIRFKNFQDSQDEDRHEESKSRQRFEEDLFRLKAKLKKAEEFRGMPFETREGHRVPNRNLWPASWRQAPESLQDESREDDSEPSEVAPPFLLRGELEAVH